MRKVIVIDPDKKFWKNIEKAINTDICEVFFIESGAHLMDKLKNESFDLIILNLELPDKNGFVYCNQIKKNPEFRNIPLIITSSEKTEKDFEQHKKLKVRAEEYLRKPIPLTTLKNVIKKFLPDIVLEKKEQKMSKPSEDLKVEDFNEENIDKLLDETFVGLIEEEEPARPERKLEKDDIAKIQNQLDSLIEENMTLKQQIEELQKGSSAEKMLQEEKEKLKEEIEKLKMALNEKKEENKELNVQLIAIQKEKGFLEKENREHLMTITTIKADYEEKIKAIESRIKQLENEKTNIEEELNSVKTEKSHLEQELISLKKEKEEKENLLFSIQQQATNLKEENQSLNEKLASLQNQIESLNERKTELENKVMEQNNTIEKLTRDYAIANEAKKALEETVFQLKEENSKLQTELTTKQKENEMLSEKSSKMEERLKLLEEKLSNTLERIKEIKRELES